MFAAAPHMGWKNQDFSFHVSWRPEGPGRGINQMGVREGGLAFSSL